MDVDLWGETQKPMIEKNLAKQLGLGELHNIYEEYGEQTKSDEPREQAKEV